MSFFKFSGCPKIKKTKPKKGLGEKYLKKKF